ncbi:MAG: flagellar basal body-associated FliL family protein [Bdellovibrionales bacterium]|nr:flagellar basal body-associated FliL family protein [Bdellovibrionales bacterium]
MADNMDSNSDTIEEDGVISLDDLDTLLADEDPSFSNEMKKMSEDEELRKAEVEVIDFEDPEGDIAEESKVSFPEKHPKLQKLIDPIKNLFRNIKLKFEDIFNSVKRKLANLLLWFKSDFPVIAKKQALDFIEATKQTAQKIKDKKHKYSALPKRTKWGIYTTIVFVVSVGGVIFISTKTSWVPSIKEPLYESLEGVADRVIEIEDGSTLKSLYRAFPQPEHYVQLEKIVVNLKRVNNYTLPMAAVEYYLELDSTETAIEIKDREKMVIDSVQRTLEEFTYNELKTKAGISKMKAAVRYSINNLLNQGRVNKVQLKTFILKP